MEKKIMTKLHPPVFLGSTILILAFVIFGTTMPEMAKEKFDLVQAWIVHNFGWFYLLAVAAFLAFSIGLAVSSYGQIKLGPDHSEPDFTYLSWFSMLFSAGMGIGLLFYGVAEPIMHFTSPPTGEGRSIEAAREAMTITFFHWGLHAWAIYAVVGLALAYFSFRLQLPLTIRSAMYPLLGQKIYGPIGDAVDIFAVLGTMFGVATSLGIGVMQINAGLNYLIPQIPNGLWTQLVLITIITLMATASVVAGLNAGIKRLSELNLILALFLLIFVMIFGPTVYLMQTLVQNTGHYFSTMIEKTFHLFAYQPNEWIGGWTLFYWGWWIAWSPFVGMFIARVSRGRTIREFILGVLFVPVGFTFIWMTFFGNSAIFFELADSAHTISNAVSDNLPIAIFKLFEQMPWTILASTLATLLVVTFFVTSSDSGSLVIDIITSGGDDNPPVWQRIFWAITEGVVAAVLLLAGGLAALKTAAIASALPFTIILLFVCYGLLKALHMEGLKRTAYNIPPSLPVSNARVSWQQRLKALVSYPQKESAQKFLQTAVQPALEEVATEIHKSNFNAEVESNDRRVALKVYFNGGDEVGFLYEVRLKSFLTPDFAFPEVFRQEKEREDETKRYFRAEVFLIDGSQRYDIMGYTKEQVIGDVLAQYDKFMHFLHMRQ